MYTRLLRKSEHTKKFSINRHQHEGWEVSEEEDSRVVLSVRYRDWHRVERAMQMFADKATSLRQRGWADYVVNDTAGRRTGRSTTGFALLKEEVGNRHS
jgi:hypothetical protein